MTVHVQNVVRRFDIAMNGLGYQIFAVVVPKEKKRSGIQNRAQCAGIKSDTTKTGKTYRIFVASARLKKKRNGMKRNVKNVGTK